MTRITTITDLRTYVADTIGEATAAEIDRVAAQLRREAHVDGLRYGDDWADWLGRITSEDVGAYLLGQRSQITADAE